MTGKSMADRGSFAAVTCYFNPCGYANRERCYRRFAARLEEQGVELWTIEAAVGSSPFFVPLSERVVQIRMANQDWIWQKERMLNQLIARLPRRIEKIAWLDNDVLFEDHQWAAKTIELLDQYLVVQPFDFVYWLGPDDEPIPWRITGQKKPGFAFLANTTPRLAGDYRVSAPGFAWAAQRDFLSRFGLYEGDVTGGSDGYMAAAFMGWLDHYLFQTASPAMAADALEYARAVFEHVNGNIGHLSGEVSHLWHGAFNNRQYSEKFDRMKQFGFDPQEHVEPDSETGLLRWTQSADPRLKDYLMQSFRARLEDAEPDSTKADR